MERAKKLALVAVVGLVACSAPPRSELDLFGYRIGLSGEQLPTPDIGPVPDATPGLELFRATLNELAAAPAAVPTLVPTLSGDQVIDAFRSWGCWKVGEHLDLLGGLFSGSWEDGAGRAWTVSQIAYADAFQGRYRDRNGVLVAIDREELESLVKQGEKAIRKRDATGVQVSPQVAGALVYVLADVVGDELAHVPLFVPELLDLPARADALDQALRSVDARRAQLGAELDDLARLGRLGTPPLYSAEARALLERAAETDAEWLRIRHDLDEVRRELRRLTCYRVHYPEWPSTQASGGPRLSPEDRLRVRRSFKVAASGLTIRPDPAQEGNGTLKIREGTSFVSSATHVGRGMVLTFTGLPAGAERLDGVSCVVSKVEPDALELVQHLGPAPLPGVDVQLEGAVFARIEEREETREVGAGKNLTLRDSMLTGAVDFELEGFTARMAVTVTLETGVTRTLAVSQVAAGSLTLTDPLGRPVPEGAVESVKGTKALPPQLARYTPFRTGAILDVIGREPIHLQWKERQGQPARVETDYDCSALVGFLVELAATQAEKGTRTAAGGASRGGWIASLDNELVAESIASLAGGTAKKFSERLSYDLLVKLITDPDVLVGELEVEAFGRKEKLNKKRLFELLREHYLDDELEDLRSKRTGRTS